MATSVATLPQRNRNTITFAGCGFMGVYHLGVCLAIREHAPHQYDKLYGTSAGSMAAVFFACNIPNSVAYKFLKAMCDEAFSTCMGRFGCLHPKYDVIQKIRSFYERTLPSDAHRICRGRVGISLTIVPDMKNWIVTDFNTRAELIQAIICSCFLPFYCGMKLPKFRGKYCCDGGATSNLPFCNDPMVVTVSPFSGECDICPTSETESYYQLYVAQQAINISIGNVYRGIGSLLFLPWNEMEKIFQQGYDNGVDFLRKEGIIPIVNEPITIDNINDATSDYFTMTTPCSSRHSSTVSRLDDILASIENDEYQFHEFDTP